MVQLEQYLGEQIKIIKSESSVNRYTASFYNLNNLIVIQTTVQNFFLFKNPRMNTARRRELKIQFLEAKKNKKMLISLINFPSK